jgi:hypothetical protein
VTDNQAQAICPQCGSADAVHSVQELSALIQGRFGQPQAGPPPGPPPGSGYVGEPQAGPPPGPQPGYVGEPQAGPPPGPGGGIPGWARTPRAGRPQGPGLGNGSGPLGLDWSTFRRSESVTDAIEDQIAGAALGAAARFIGKRIGKKVQQAYTERVQPAMEARRDAMLSEQQAIAERHPGLRACLNDKVIFLAGGSRVVPLSSVRGGFTVEQADAIVAQLSGP